MRTRSIAAVLAVVSVIAVAARAQANKHVHFLGPHPIAAKYGGGYCYIETPHMHVYVPDHSALYQQVGDQYVFTGDPTPFGYDGEKHPFYGHHPVVTVGAEPVYCYINGPHYHSFAAPALPDYQVKNGVAFYVGAYPPQYTRVKRERMRVVNAEYRPYVAFRPTVEVEPPPEWHGEIYTPGVVVAAPGVAVAAPGVAVAAPGVVVSAPGVYVAPPPRVVVGAPGVVVGAPGVVVGAPGVYVGGPGPVVVEERDRHWRHDEDKHWEHDEKHWEHERRKEEHHDNGRHEGWGKHH